MTRLVSSRDSSGNPAKAFRIPIDDLPLADLHILDKLVEANFVSKSECFFEATTLLLSHLKLVRQLDPLNIVAASFETTEPTTHQLLQQLEDQGFQWKQLTKQESITYEVGQEKTWHQRSRGVP